MPNFFIRRPLDEDEKISAEGKKYFGPELRCYYISSKNQDLINSRTVKMNDGANPNAFHEFLCVIKYVLNTNNCGMKLEYYTCSLIY